MKKQLIDKCNKFIKNGKADKVYDYIMKNDLTKEFIAQAFYSTYQHKSKDYENEVNLSNFALKILMEDLTLQYGEKLANKFAQIIYNTPEPNQRIYYLFRLMNLHENQISEIEADKIEKILDIGSNKEQVIGTHIIGSDIR